MKKMFSRKKPVMTEEEGFRKIAMEQVKKEMKQKRDEEKKKKQMKKKMKSPKVAMAPSMQSSSVEPMVFEEAHSTQFMPRTEVMQRLSIQTPKIDYGAEERKQAKKNAELFSMSNMRTGQRRYYGGVKPSSVGVEGIDIDFKN